MVKTNRRILCTGGDEMITITVLKNPFNYNDKEILTCEYVPGKTAYEYVQPYIMGMDDFVVSVSGNIVEDAKEQTVNSDDWLAVCPVVGKSGSDWFRTIFTLALTFVTNSWANAWASPGYSLTPAGVLATTPAAMTQFGAYMAAGALNMIGGSLINSAFPPAKADRQTYDISPTYSWSNANAPTDQGNALAVTYGTMRTAGQIIAQHVSSDGDKQYLNILLCGGEGPIDDITDVRINDNPIRYYFKDVPQPYEPRLGTNDQAVIENFNYTYFDEALAYELNNDSKWITRQTEGNAVEGLEITVELPYGLFYANDSGGLDNASVTLQAQYHRVGEDNWTSFYDGTSTDMVITAAKNTSFFRTYRVNNLPAGQYEVQVRCIAKSGINNRFSTRVYWTQLSSIMYDRFARPGKVLIGIKALATNQLSGGMPSVTWLQSRNNVWVWNPNTSQYEPKPATNPAWAAYDMIHRCRQIKNINKGNLEFVVQGAPASRAVYQDFANWAEFCDERNLTFNYIYNTATDLWTALQKPESVGRGKVIMRGTRFGCVYDAPGQPVQLFTVGNIITDKFKETFMGIKDRANAIEITFVNKDKDYLTDVVTAYADDYDGVTEPNITQITLDGATTVEQAYREGKYRLRLNQYLQRTVEHSADIDAIACQINDVVLLAHDVPQWGFSGRLLDAPDTQTLQLDREVTLKPDKSYAVAVQVTNPAATTAQAVQSIVTVGVKGVVEETSTDTVELTSELTSIPQKWDLYSFGETNKVVKPFRVINITRDQDMKRKITCLEYIEEIYNEATDIPQINYSELDKTVEVSNVSVAEETYRQKDGTVVSKLNVAWRIPRDKLVSGYKVFYSSDDGQTWNEWGNSIKDVNTSILGVKTNTNYIVKVCTVSYAGVVSTGVVAYPVYVTGKDVPPSDVASLSASLDATDLTKINLSWSAVNDIDLAGYRIREDDTIIENLAKITTYTFTATENRLHSFKVTAVDNSGNESINPKAANIIPTVYPATPTGFTAIQNGDYVYLYWNKNDATDIAGYEIRQGVLFNNGTLVQTGITGTDLLVPVSTETNYRYHIKAINKAGKYSLIDATAEVAVYGLTPRNVILSFDEMVLQNGTHSNTEFGSSHYTCLTLGGRCGDYPSTQCNQVGGSEVLKLAPLVTANLSRDSTAYESDGSQVVSGVPRFETNGITVEEGTTNYISAADITSWTTYVSSSATGAFTSGTDTNYGKYVTIQKTDTGSGRYGKSYSLSGLSGQAYTYSVWVRPKTTTGRISVYIDASKSGGGLMTASNYWDLSSLPLNQWTRLFVTYPVTGSNTLAGTATCYVWMDSAAGVCDFAEPQLEQKTYATSFINGTRAAESLTIPGSVLNASQGTILIDIFLTDQMKTKGDLSRVLYIYNGTSNNDLYLSYLTSQKFELFTTSNSGVPSIVTSAVYTTNGLVRVGITWSVTEAALWVNGVKYSIPSPNIPAIMTALQIGGQTNGARFINSQVSNLHISNIARDDVWMQANGMVGARVGVDNNTTCWLPLLKSLTQTATSGEYLAARINLGGLIKVNLAADFISTALLSAGNSAQLWFRHSRDGVNFEEWKIFAPTTITTQYIDFYVALASADETNFPIEVGTFRVSADVDDVEKTGSAIIPTGGTTVNYGHTFLGGSGPNNTPIFTPVAIGAGLRAEVISAGLASAVVKVVNASGADVGGTITYRVKGYGG
jgi:predicted phage tail protein